MRLSRRKLIHSRARRPLIYLLRDVFRFEFFSSLKNRKAFRINIHKFSCTRVKNSRKKIRRAKISAAIAKTDDSSSKLPAAWCFGSFSSSTRCWVALMRSIFILIFCKISPSRSASMFISFTRSSSINSLPLEARIKLAFASLMTWQK